VEKLEEIYNGNTKTLYKTENPDLLVMSYNNLVVVDEDKRENVEGKARFTNLLNNHKETDQWKINCQREARLPQNLLGRLKIYLLLKRSGKKL